MRDTFVNVLAGIGIFTSIFGVLTASLHLIFEIISRVKNGYIHSTRNVNSVVNAKFIQNVKNVVLNLYFNKNYNIFQTIFPLPLIPLPYQNSIFMISGAITKKFFIITAHAR